MKINNINSNSSVTISGATGWLGIELIKILKALDLSNLKLDLISSKEQEIKIDNDIFTTSVFRNSRLNTPDIYFDFAFLTREKINTFGPEKFKMINMDIINNSVKLIKLQQPKTVILASSGAIYGEGRRNHEGDNYLYSMLKQIQEDKITEVCSKIGAKLIVARIFNLSGSGISKINTFAISEMIVNATKGHKLYINSNFLVFRRYCDISQLLRLLIAANNNNFIGVIDSGGIKIELHHLAQTIINEIGSKSELVFPDIGKNAISDEYFSKSQLYEDLILKYSDETPFSITEQINITKNFLFPVS